jgi:hypothetical protein
MPITGLITPAQKTSLPEINSVRCKECIVLDKVKPYLLKMI